MAKSAILALGAATAVSASGSILDERTVQRINENPASAWNAELSPRFAGVSRDEALSMLGVLRLYDDEYDGDGAIKWGPRPNIRAPPEGIPTEFDARVHWAYNESDPESFNCSVIHTVENQGGCGSCWAFGSSEAFSDRTCIASKGKVNLIMSPQEVTSCAGCMEKAGGLNTSCAYNGCGGGQPHTAWEFFAEDGLVDVTCWPYGGGNESDYFKPNTTKPVVRTTLADLCRVSSRVCRSIHSLSLRQSSSDVPSGAGAGPHV
jgi:hypothetical protein